MNEADSLLSDPPFFTNTEEFDELHSLVPENGTDDDHELRRSARDVGRQRRTRIGDSDSSEPSTSKSPVRKHMSRSNTLDLKEEKEVRKVVSVKPSMAPVTDIHASYPDWSVLERELEAAKTHENAYFLDSSFLRALTVMDYWLSAEGPFFMPRREFRHRHCIFNLFWQPSAPNWEKSEYVVPPRLDGLLRWYLTRDNFINKEAGNRLQDITSYLPQDSQVALSRRGWSLYIMNMVYQSGNQLIFRKDNEKEYQPYFGSTAKSQLRSSLLPEMSPDLFEALCHRLAPQNLREKIATLPDLTLGPIPPIEMASVRTNLEDYRANELVALRKSQPKLSSRKRKVEQDADYVGEDPRPVPSHSNVGSSANSSSGSDIHGSHGESGSTGFRSGSVVGDASDPPSSISSATISASISASTSGSSVSFNTRGDGLQRTATVRRGATLEEDASSSQKSTYLSRAGRNTSRAMQNMQHRLNDAMEEEEFPEESVGYDEGGGYFGHHPAGGLVHEDHSSSFRDSPHLASADHMLVDDHQSGNEIGGASSHRSSATSPQRPPANGLESHHRHWHDPPFLPYGPSNPSAMQTDGEGSQISGASLHSAASISASSTAHPSSLSHPSSSSSGHPSSSSGHPSSSSGHPSSLGHPQPPPLPSLDHVGSPFGSGGMNTHIDDDLSDLSTSSSSRKRNSGSHNRKDTKTPAKRRKLANSASDHLPSRHKRLDREIGHVGNSREAQRSGSAVAFSTTTSTAGSSGVGPSSAASLSPSTSSTSLATATDLHQLENSLNSSLQLLQRTIAGLFGKLHSAAHQHQSQTASHLGASLSSYTLASTLDLSLLQDRIHHSIYSLASIQHEYDQLGQTIDSAITASSPLPPPSASYPSPNTNFSSPLHLNMAESQTLASRWPMMNHMGAFSIPYPHHPPYSGSKLPQGSVDNSFYDISAAQAFQQQQGSLQGRNDVSHSFSGPVPFFGMHHPLHASSTSFLDPRELVPAATSTSTHNQGQNGSLPNNGQHQKNISSGDSSGSTVSNSGLVLGSGTTGPGSGSSIASSSSSQNTMSSVSPLASPPLSQSGTHSNSGDAKKRSPSRTAGGSRTKQQSSGMRNPQTKASLPSSQSTPSLSQPSSTHPNDIGDTTSSSDNHFTSVHSESSHSGRQTISYDWTTAAHTTTAHSAAPFLHPSTGTPLSNPFFSPSPNMNTTPTNLLGSSAPLPYFPEQNNDGYGTFPRLYPPPPPPLTHDQPLHQHHYAPNSTFPTGRALSHHGAFPSLHSTTSPHSTANFKKDTSTFY